MNSRRADSMKVYIVATYTGTTLARMIKRLSDTQYSHISISLNENLNPMYAFGRLHPRTPIFAGLVEEHINEGLYAIKKDTVCRVCELEVTPEQYYMIKSNLENMWATRKSLSYDAGGLLWFAMNKPRKRGNRFVCSTFVSKTLEDSGIDLFGKPYYEVQPLDFTKTNKNLKVVYEGLLSEYNINTIALHNQLPYSI